ncbi:MAG: homoserine kinase type II [Alphaproteobacteria bacterium]|jgi:homoserine kinase type II
MAVYTRFTDAELLSFLGHYSVGIPVKIIDIEQGVENSNYFLITTTGKYVLTIYEKRVNLSDLPYFLAFSEHLSENNIKTPLPIRNHHNQSFTDFKDKKAAIIQFLEGANLDIPNVAQCASAGDFVAQMHIAQNGFKQMRVNNLSPKDSLWDLYHKIEDNLRHSMPDLFPVIAEDVTYLKQNYPLNTLPIGNVHTDIFPDNMFFNDNKAIGVIDFYFSCTDFLAYDLAITLCAWCFDKGIFNQQKFNAMLDAYQCVRPLDISEKDALIILMHGAAMRFFLTRAHDYLYHDKNALVKAKNPQEYYNIITFLRTPNTIILT